MSDDRSTDQPPAPDETDGTTDRGAAAGGGAREAGETGDADRAVEGESPLQAAGSASGIGAFVRAWFAELTGEERTAVYGLLGFVAFLAVLTGIGFLNPAYLLYLLSLAGMYLLLSMGLNVQWGYTGLINFSVAAFFGLGAYGTALVSSSDSPLLGGQSPILGLLVGLVLAGILAVIIGIPTLSLREDYLAIASLGLAEVVRQIINNEEWLTGGSAGLSGIPRFYAGWPLVSDLPRGAPTSAANLLLVSLFVAGTYLFLRRIHRSPWGRVQRTIRADEDLAEALGKDTYRFKMESFVIGSLIMALAGVFYAHLTLFISPTALEPTQTFYVWVAVILGGTGSNRGAMFGGLIIIAIQQGTRFVTEITNAIAVLPEVPGGPLRLLTIGVIIIAIIRYRPEGLLPPQRELVWPGAEGEPMGNTGGGPSGGENDE